MANADLTAQRLRELLAYNPETGLFTWRVACPQVKRTRVGGPVGNLRDDGYMTVKINGRRLYQHRLAWLYVYGEWPAGVIDHINHHKADNRIANLRDATKAENGQNRIKFSRVSASGRIGVRPCDGGWFAQITVHGRQIGLGWRKNLKDAIALRVAAEVQHGFTVL